MSVLVDIVFKARRRARAYARASSLVLTMSFAGSGAILLAGPGTLAAAIAPSAAASLHAAAPVKHSLLSSRELWATVDVCAPKDQPDTVGIRGSMPGDPREPGAAMYMRFQLQYREVKSGTWANLAHGAASSFIEVGTGRAARQGGTSFQLSPAKSSAGYTLRGLVSFQWRHQGQVVHETDRTTSAGHQSLAGSDPPGYSAAECTIPA
jgi:hypothetical protein